MGANVHSRKYICTNKVQPDEDWLSHCRSVQVQHRIWHPRCRNLPQNLTMWMVEELARQVLQEVPWTVCVSFARGSLLPWQLGQCLCLMCCRWLVSWGADQGMVRYSTQNQGYPHDGWLDHHLCLKCYRSEINLSIQGEERQAPPKNGSCHQHHTYPGSGSCLVQHL